MQSSNTLNLAVIILNYFGFDDSVTCIKSVKDSLQSTIFLVDNSADANERAKLEDTFKIDPRIKLIFPEENLGFAVGVNLALRAAGVAGFQNFILLNNDAVLSSDAGDVFAKAFMDHPGSLLSPAIVSGENTNRGYYYQKYLGLISKEPYFNGIGSLYYFSGCAVGLDKEVLDMIGYLNESFFFYGEDVEFSYRAQKHNIKLILLPEKLVRHEGTKSSKIASLFYEYYLNHSHFLLTSRTIDNPLKRLLAYLSKSFVLSIRAVIRSFRYKSLIPLWAFLIGPLPIKIRPRRSNYQQIISRS